MFENANVPPRFQPIPKIADVRQVHLPETKRLNLSELIKAAEAVEYLGSEKVKSKLNSLIIGEGEKVPLAMQDTTRDPDKELLLKFVKDFEENYFKRFMEALSRSRGGCRHTYSRDGHYEGNGNS